MKSVQLEAIAQAGARARCVVRRSLGLLAIVTDQADVMCLSETLGSPDFLVRAAVRAVDATLRE